MYPVLSTVVLTGMYGLSTLRLFYPNCIQNNTIRCYNERFLGPWRRPRAFPIGTPSRRAELLDAPRTSSRCEVRDQNTRANLDRESLAGITASSSRIVPLNYKRTGERIGRDAPVKSECEPSETGSNGASQQT